jgi:hypothetical protein
MRIDDHSWITLSSGLQVPRAAASLASFSGSSVDGVRPRWSPYDGVVNVQDFEADQMGPCCFVILLGPFSNANPTVSTHPIYLVRTHHCSKGCWQTWGSGWTFPKAVSPPCALLSWEISGGPGSSWHFWTLCLPNGVVQENWKCRVTHCKASKRAKLLGSLLRWVHYL